MRFDQADRLLNPAPMPLETGYERLADGVLHVAVRTELPGCTGEMFEWWFRSAPDTSRYVWWHPSDHVSSRWTGLRRDTHVGSVHHVEERFDGGPVQALSIQFRDNLEIFDAALLAQAQVSGAVSAAVCGRVGEGHAPPMDADGAVLGSRLLHIGRDTPAGLVLRSRFWLGQDLPGAGHAPETLAALAPESAAQALIIHCLTEFTHLSRFLPSLHEAESGAAVKRVW